MEKRMYYKCKWKIKPNKWALLSCIIYMLHLSRGKWDKIPQMVLVYTIHYMLERASLNVDLNNQGQKNKWRVSKKNKMLKIGKIIKLADYKMPPTFRKTAC